MDKDTALVYVKMFTYIYLAASYIPDEDIASEEFETVIGFVGQWSKTLGLLDEEELLRSTVEEVISDFEADDKKANLLKTMRLLENLNETLNEDVHKILVSSIEEVLKADGCYDEKEVLFLQMVRELLAGTTPSCDYLEKFIEPSDKIDSGMSARQLAEFVMRLSVYRKSLYPDAMMVQARGFASFDNQSTVVKGVVKLVDPDNDTELESEIGRAERYFEAVLDAAGNQPMQFNIVVGGDNDPVSSLNITPQKSNTWLLIVEAQGKAFTLIAVGGTPEGETEPQAFRYPDELDQIVKYTGVPAQLLS